MYRLEKLENQLIETATGRQIRDLFEEHVEEVMMLINNNRNVKVSWHRNQGPEFINHAVKSGIEQGFEIPDEIKGIHKMTLLRRMAAAIQESGSPMLRQVIGKYTAIILNWAQRSNSLHQVFEEIKNMDTQNPSN